MHTLDDSLIKYSIITDSELCPPIEHGKVKYQRCILNTSRIAGDGWASIHEDTTFAVYRFPS